MPSLTVQAAQHRLKPTTVRYTRRGMANVFMGLQRRRVASFLSGITNDHVVIEKATAQ